jgi:hypothetical protein
MRHATTLSNERRRAVGAATCLALSLALAGCGSSGGKDRSFQLPPGIEFDATRSGRALIVVETHNECANEGECAAPTSGPCELGNGNVRGLAIYRLGSTGLLFQDPADTRPAAAPERVIGTSDNPRRVVVHPADPTLVYVATEKRIQVFRLASGGGTSCIAQTASEKEIKPDVKDELDPIDMVIDPTFGEKGILYVASKGADRVDAYTIAADGTIPSQATSCAVGPNQSEYAAVTLAGAGFIVAGGRTRIDVYERSNGQFPPRTKPDGTTESSCIGATTVSTVASSLGAAFVTDAFFMPTPATPLGQLFIAEEVSRRSLTFPLDAAGALADSESSSTKRTGVPQNMLLTQRGGSSILYVSIFNEGRVDVFQLENGLLPGPTFSRTAEDPDTLPVGLALDPTSASTLYVAEGGRGRVDGFRIQPDGGLTDLPATSTGPILGPTGKDVDSFPNDLAIVPLS